MPSQTIIATHYVLDRYKRGSHCVWPASLRNLQNLANELRAFVYLAGASIIALAISFGSQGLVQDMGIGAIRT